LKDGKFLSKMLGESKAFCVRFRNVPIGSPGQEKLMKSLITSCAIAGLLCGLLLLPPAYSDDAPAAEKKSDKAAERKADKKADRAAEKKKNDAGLNPVSEPVGKVERLPNFFRKLKLSPKQHEDVLAAQKKWNSQINELQKQIASLKEQRDAEIRQILSEKQQEQLDALAKESKEKAAAKKAEAAAANGKEAGEAKAASGNGTAAKQEQKKDEKKKE